MNETIEISFEEIVSNCKTCGDVAKLYSKQNFNIGGQQWLPKK